MTSRARRLLAAVAVTGLGATIVAVWSDRSEPGSAPRVTDQRGQAGRFVGSARCAACHEVEFRAWKGSQHEQAMQAATGESVLGDFGDRTFTYNGVTSTFSKRGADFYVRTDGKSGTLEDFRIAYTFGVYPLQQYLVEFPDGRLQALSIAWDARPPAQGGGRWFHLYPEDRIDSRDELHWTGRLQNWNFMCADCHSTGVRKGYNESADRFRTSWQETSVGCEACHGPGEAHSRSADSARGSPGGSAPATGLAADFSERRRARWTTNPVTGRPERNVPRPTDLEGETCAPCHARRQQIAEGFRPGEPLADYYALATIDTPLYHADGQQIDEVYTTGSFRQSRMFQAGVTCSDCHDPHTSRPRAAGNALCTRCHQAGRYDSPTHHFHGAPAASSGTACVACHMPAQTYMRIDPRRDHSFPVPRPDLTVVLGTPNACTACHTTRSPAWAAAAVRRWLGRDARGFQTFAAAVASHDRQPGSATAPLLALTNDPAQPAIVRAGLLSRVAATPSVDTLATAAGLSSDPDPTVRRAAVSAFGRIAPRERLAALPFLGDAARSVRTEAARVLAPAAALIATADDRRRFDGAAAEYVAAERLHADRPETRANLGIFFADIDRPSEAAAELRAAIRLEPRFVAAYVNLADVLAKQGQEAAAEDTLREGLVRSPDHADLHHALGLSLARSNKHDEAVRELGRAATLRPDEPRYAYAHAVALHSTGRPDEAVGVLTRGLGRHPRDRDLLFALATFHRDAGRLADARRAATNLRAAHPTDAEGIALAQALGLPESSASSR